MPPVETMSAVILARVSERTKKAFVRRAARERKRQSQALRELIEGYAHPTKKSV